MSAEETKVVEEASKAQMPPPPPPPSPSMVMAHAFAGDADLGQLTVGAGESVELLKTHKAEGWVWVKSASGDEGYVPEGYLE